MKSKSRPITYIVSGYMRSGTSMMMMALEAGGLVVAYDPRRDRLIERYGDEDYQPNPALYELSRQQYLEPGFPRQYEGKLIKCLCAGVPRIVAGHYKVAFMLRDYEEIRQSHMAFFGHPPKMSAEAYEALMENSLGILRERRDVAVAVLRYREVVNSPLAAFERLRGAGWAIDPTKAAAIVNPEFCRYRHENLEVGVL